MIVFNARDELSLS